jgi:hypothetical protein
MGGLSMRIGVVLAVAWGESGRLALRLALGGEDDSRGVIEVAPLHNIFAGLGLTVILAACGGSGLSLSEYGDRLNEIVGTYEPQAEAAWGEFLQLPEPTLQDVKTLFDRNAAIRTEAEAAFRDLDPPDEIADLHILLVDWLTSLRQAGEAVAARVGTLDSWDEFLQSAEYQTFETTLIGGAEVCNEYQAKLDATAAGGIFADTPWIPGDLKEVVEAVVGCDTIPEDLDPAFER